MTSEKLKELTLEELLLEEKKQKNSAWTFRVIIVLAMCAALWSATHKGSMLISWSPLILVFFFGKIENNYKAVQTEIKTRQSS